MADFHLLNLNAEQLEAAAGRDSLVSIVQHELEIRGSVPSLSVLFA